MAKCLECFCYLFTHFLVKTIFFQRVSGVGVDTYGNSGVVGGYFCVQKNGNCGQEGGYQYFLELHLIYLGQHLFKMK